MKEEEVAMLLGSYRDAAGTCSRVPESRTRGTAVRRTSLYLGMAAALAVGAFLFVPRSASAALDRVGRALGEVQSMEVLMYSDFDGGQWRLCQTTQMLNGAWRMHWGLETPLEAVRIKRGDMALLGYKRLGYATLQPVRLKEEHEARDPLSFAKELTNYGEVPKGRTIKTLDNGFVDGVPTYKIVMDRASDSYHAEILVDAHTDLPMRAEFQYDVTGMDRFRYEFRFNRDLDPKLFRLESDKPIVRIPEAGELLGTKWTASLGTGCHSVVRDASISPDGTVWIAVGSTVPDGDLPTTLTADNGAIYTRTMDITPSAIKGRQPQRISGENINIVGFVPLDPSAPMPTSVKVWLEHRTAHHPGGSESPATAGTSGTSPIPLTPRREPGNVPGYFSALDLDYLTLQVQIMKWTERARALEKAERFVEAAKAFEQTAVEYRNFVPSAGYRPLNSAAWCYEKAGMVEKAELTREAARVLKESRARS